MNRQNRILIAVAALIAVGALVFMWRGGPGHMQSTANAGIPVDVRVPALSDIAARGQRRFDEICAACHGENAAGTDQGPPLVHKIYEPNHHGDHAFRAAVKAGVRAHHWRFGNMPPQPDISPDEIERIIVYVRELQKENGIF